MTGGPRQYRVQTLFLAGALHVLAKVGFRRIGLPSSALSATTDNSSPGAMPSSLEDTCPACGHAAADSDQGGFLFNLTAFCGCGDPACPLRESPWQDALQYLLGQHTATTISAVFKGDLKTAEHRRIDRKALALTRSRASGGLHVPVPNCQNSFAVVVVATSHLDHSKRSPPARAQGLTDVCLDLHLPLQWHPRNPQTRFAVTPSGCNALSARVEARRAPTELKTIRFPSTKAACL